MLKLLCPFTAGTLLAPLVPAGSQACFWWGNGAALLVLYWLHRRKDWRSGSLFFWVFLLTQAWFGLSVATWMDPLERKGHFQHHREEGMLLLARLQQIRTTSSGKQRLRLAVRWGRSSDGAWQPLAGRLEAYLPTDSLSRSLRPGALLAFPKRPERVSSPKNPASFDYRAYLARQGIYHQVFLREGEWQEIHTGTRSLPGLLSDLRAEMLRRLRIALPAEQDLGLAAALLIGSKEQLPDDAREAYARAGVAHVLAVSGLHVGILAFGLRFLFGLLPLPGRWRTPMALSGVLLTLAGYCLLTGLSPSVQRATLMYGLILFGTYFPARGYVYNSLAFAAWVMMLVQPSILLDVGFQLSFLAVLGIVFFQPYLALPFRRAPRLVREVWSLFTVSLAAQLATFPLTLYYFHAFPFYFWLSGLFIVPLIKLILYAGIAFLVGGGMEVLLWEKLAAGCLRGLVKLTNRLVEWLANLPGGHWEGIPMDAADLLLVYSALLGGVLILRKTRRLGAWWLLISLGLVSLKRIQAGYEQSSSRTVAVYALSRGRLLMDLFDGRAVFTLTSGEVDRRSEEYAAAGFRLQRGARPVFRCAVDSVPTAESGALYLLEGHAFFSGFRIAVVDAQPAGEPLSPIPVDMLVLTGQEWKDFNRLARQYHPALVVLVPPNHRVEASWIQALQDRGWPFYSIRKEGALVKEISPSNTQTKLL